MFYLFEFHWCTGGRFTSNAEYAMLLVYVITDKMDLKSDAHRHYLFFVCCYLLCHVLHLPYLVIIPVLHYGLTRS